MKTPPHLQVSGSGLLQHAAGPSTSKYILGRLRKEEPRIRTLCNSFEAFYARSRSDLALRFEFSESLRCAAPAVSLMYVVRHCTMQPFELPPLLLLLFLPAMFPQNSLSRPPSSIPHCQLKVLIIHALSCAQANAK